MKDLQIKERLKKAIDTMGRVTIIAAALLIGFGAGKMYSLYVGKPSATSAGMMPRPSSMNETSIAVNERGELMVIDRRNGSYQIYSDSVGRSIFNLYAGQMYAKMNSK
jgi:hypothetical protein